MRFSLRSGGGKTDNARDIFSAGTQTAFLATTGNERLERDVMSDIESTDTFGAAALSSADSEQINAEASDIQVKQSECLGSVGMEKKREFDSLPETGLASRTNDFGNLRERLDSAEFIIDEGNRDERDIISELGAEIGEVDEAGRLDADGLVRIGLRGGEDGGMLSGKSEKSSGRISTEGSESEVDRFGGTGGNDKVGTFGADGMGELILGGFVGEADMLSGEIRGGRVEKFGGKIGLHSGEGVGSDWGGGSVIEINEIFRDSKINVGWARR